MIRAGRDREQVGFVRHALQLVLRGSCCSPSEWMRGHAGRVASDLGTPADVYPCCVPLPRPRSCVRKPLRGSDQHKDSMCLGTNVKRARAPRTRPEQLTGMTGFSLAFLRGGPFVCRHRACSDGALAPPNPRGQLPSEKRNRVPGDPRKGPLDHARGGPEDPPRSPGHSGDASPRAPLSTAHLPTSGWKVGVLCQPPSEPVGGRPVWEPWPRAGTFVAADREVW